MCVDALSEEVPFEVERGDGVVRLRGTALVVSLWLEPFRLDVHRADGSAVVETAQDADGAHVSIPFFYHHAQPAGTMAGSFVDNGQRARYDFSEPDEYAIHFERAVRSQV